MKKCENCPYQVDCEALNLCFREAEAAGDRIINGIDIERSGEPANPECLHCAIGEFLNTWLKEHPRPAALAVRHLMESLVDFTVIGPWMNDLDAFMQFWTRSHELMDRLISKRLSQLPIGKKLKMDIMLRNCENDRERSN